MGNFRLYSRNSRLIAEYNLNNDFSVEEIFIDELFRKAFDLVMTNGIRYPRNIPHSKYNIDKDAPSALKILSLMLMYKETSRMRIDVS